MEFIPEGLIANNCSLAQLMAWFLIKCLPIIEMLYGVPRYRALMVYSLADENETLQNWNIAPMQHS